MAEAIEFVDPISQSLLINFVASQTTENPEPFWKALLYCFISLAGNLTIPLAWGAQSWFERRAFIHIESSLRIAVYKKCLKMSSQAKQTSDTGELVNHISLDADRVAQLVK